MPYKKSVLKDWYSLISSYYFTIVFLIYLFFSCHFPSLAISNNDTIPFISSKKSMKKILLTDKAPAPIGPYSQGIFAGNLLFLSGQIPLSADGTHIIGLGDIAAQTKQVLANIDALLKAAGLTANDVVKTTVFIKDMNDFPVINTVYNEYFGESKPARSTVEVSRLPKDVLIEIETIALINK